MKNCQVELNVTGMHCSGCENRIKNVVSDIKEVKNVDANHETGKVNITLKKDLTDEVLNEIKTKIENLDFKVIN